MYYILFFFFAFSDIIWVNLKVMFMDILGREDIPLKTDSKPFYYNKESLIELKKELEDFLATEGKYMNDRSLAQKFLGCQEIQANNSVEGYNDDAGVIERVLTDDYRDRLPLERERIIKNLYGGYQEIQKGKDINKDNLKSLYDILSDGLLSSCDLGNMGDYYRNGDVLIHYSRNIETPPDEGINSDLVPSYMDSLFEFLNDDSSDSMIDDYVKSQIAHFYFVYVHPYFDVNGRSARTFALWYLLNNEAYPYIIFNRAIPLFKKRYNRNILGAKRTFDLTRFLRFMLCNVKDELFKEYIILSLIHI